MGGLNSGGHNHNGRPVLEQCPCLRIGDLKRIGLLNFGAKASGCIGSFARVDFSTDYDDGIVLVMTDLRSSPGQSHSEFLGFQTRHLRTFGGFQAYFVCPGCSDLFTKLCFFRWRYRCRRCHRLQYLSQRQRSHDRTIERARRMEAKLTGLPPDVCTGLDGTPPRPKGMHRVTYEKIVTEFRRAEAAFYCSIPKRIRSAVMEIDRLKFR